LSDRRPDPTIRPPLVTFRVADACAPDLVPGQQEVEWAELQMTCAVARQRDILPMCLFDISQRYIEATLTENPVLRCQATCAARGWRQPGGSDMSSGQLYDTIGATYTVTWRTEPRIAARVWATLGDARTVLNVGAGTGSYEPSDRDVTAVEPSAVMRAQRPPDAAPCVAAAAESLPFEDQSFDAAMAFSTVHHWQDPIAGLREMRRVARRVVVFTFDASEFGWRRRFWLTRDYLPEVAGLVAGWSLAELADTIGARTEPVLIPWDCADGFFEAYWRRPEAYLDDHVRRAVSMWTRVGPEAEQRAVRSLRDDLASGRWAERNRELANLDAAELGLRLLVA
jgi:SAM-dependent methyltransferase